MKRELDIQELTSSEAGGFVDGFFCGAGLALAMPSGGWSLILAAAACGWGAYNEING